MAAEKKRSAAAFAFSNPILAANQVGRETDTGRTKIGDGVTAWASLAYQDEGEPGELRVNTQTGTSYTAVLTDRGKLVEFGNAGATTFTIPPNADVAFPIGTVIEWRQYGAGAVTLTPGAGVTLRAPAGGTLVTNGAYSEGRLVKRGTNEWVVSGNTVPAP